MAERRHGDDELLGLARDGSAPALASLLNRHRTVLQRAVLPAADPERAAVEAMTAAVRALHAGTLTDPAALPGILEAAARDAAARAPREVDVEPLLPGDWFDRAWVEAGRTWPTGRRRLPPLPRWAAVAAAGLGLAAIGAAATFIALSSGGDREVIGTVVATPLEGGSVLDDAPATPAPAAEQAPELFGDVETGELPTYDLTGPGGPGTSDGPGAEVAPPAG